MKRLALSMSVLATAMLLTVHAQQSDAPKKPDPLARTYQIAPEKMFGILGRFVAEQWKVTHSDKDLCLVAFEVPMKLTSSGFDGTVTCEASDAGSIVRVKVRQKSALSLKGKEEGFAKSFFDGLTKATAGG